MSHRRAREAIAEYKESGRAFIDHKVRKEFSGQMYNGIVKSFAGKAGTEYVKKRGISGGAHD